METKEETRTEPEIMDCKQAAKFLTISVSTLYVLNARGKLPTKYVGKKPVFFKEDLIDYLKHGKIQEA